MGQIQKDPKSDFIKNTVLGFQNIIKQSSRAASASYTLLASLVIFMFVGNYIDGIYNSSPNGIILGLCLGLFVGFYNLAKAIWK